MSRLSLLFVFYCSASQAVENFHFRTGTVSATLSAANSESFAVSPTLESEYEIFSKPKRSFGIRTTVGMASDTGKVLYFGTLLGQRYYFSGSGYNYIKNMERSSISYRKSFRTYAFYDVGFSLVNARSLGDLFQAVSLLLEGAGGVGMNFSLSNRMAFDFRIAMGYGFGISSVALTAITTNIGLGLRYQF